MSKVMIACKFDKSLTPEQLWADKTRYVGFQEIKCHIIFDVKMDLTWKARFLAGGHLTEAPPSITYSSVVSRDSVTFASLIAALNDLEIFACDFGNAYLNTPCREKIWFVAGPEFGSRQGTVIKIVRALYGLKSSGTAWRSMFNTSFIYMGFERHRCRPWRLPTSECEAWRLLILWEYIGIRQRCPDNLSWPKCASCSDPSWLLIKPQQHRTTGAVPQRWCQTSDATRGAIGQRVLALLCL